MILLSHSYPWTVKSQWQDPSLCTPQFKQSGNLLSYIFGSFEVKQASTLGDSAGQQCHQGCSPFTALPFWLDWRSLQAAVWSVSSTASQKRKGLPLFSLGMRTLTRNPKGFFSSLQEQGHQPSLKPISDWRWWWLVVSDWHHNCLRPNRMYPRGDGGGWS